MRRLVPLVFAFVGACMMVGCEDEKRSYVDNVTDPETTATMTTTDVTTLISDSGYTRYRVTTPLWLVFDEAQIPNWKFPEGLQLQQYDNDFKPSAKVECDSAVYLSSRRLWRLDGHVVMVNTRRDTFLTTQIFWDQTSAKVYSDSFIHIVREDRIIEGYGFESNEAMTEYNVRKPSGIIPIEDPRARKNAAPADSMAAAPKVDMDVDRPKAPERASRRNQNLIFVNNQ